MRISEIFLGISFENASETLWTTLKYVQVESQFKEFKEGVESNDRTRGERLHLGSAKLVERGGLGRFKQPGIVEKFQLGSDARIFFSHHPEWSQDVPRFALTSVQHVKVPNRKCTVTIFSNTKQIHQKVRLGPWSQMKSHLYTVAMGNCPQIHQISVWKIWKNHLSRQIQTLQVPIKGGVLHCFNPSFSCVNRGIWRVNWPEMDRHFDETSPIPASPPG